MRLLPDQVICDPIELAKGGNETAFKNLVASLRAVIYKSKEYVSLSFITPYTFRSMIVHDPIRTR